MKKGYIWGLTSGFLWAVSGILYQSLYLKYPGLSTFLFSILILLFIDIISLVSIGSLFLKNHKLPKITKNNFIIIFSGMLGGPIAMISYLKAIELINISYVASISALYPIFVVIFQLKSQDNFKQLFSLILAILCVLILNLSNTSEEIRYIGILLSIFSALSWAMEIIISNHIMMKKVEGIEGIYFIRQLSSVLGYTIFIVFIFIYDSSKDISSVVINYDIYLYILFLAISSGSSYFLYYKSIDRLRPIRAMSLNMTYGAWSVILSAIFLEQHVDVQDIFIIAIFITSVFNLILSEK